MSLANLSLKLSYRSSSDHLLDDFFTPCLEHSVQYRRAAGYFTSNGLALAARGVASLVIRNGTMRLIASPYLEEKDAEALQKAVDTPSVILESIVARSLEEIENVLIRDRLNALAWLAASNRLKIKLAIRVDEGGKFRQGLYHEKFGIFSDDLNQHVAFSGSSNETAGGLVENFESLKVFSSWNDTEGRVRDEIEHFEELWNDTVPGLKVEEFSEVGTKLLQRYRQHPAKVELDPNLEVAETENSYPTTSKEFEIPPGLRLRGYQKEAIRAWSDANGKGILAMATGSGKTLTALSLAERVYQKNKPLVLVIVCPFLNLCQQWIKELSNFKVQAIPCFQNKLHWSEKLEQGYQRLSIGLSQLMVLVCTNATFSSKAFQSKLKTHLDDPVIHLLIADEVHNLGAKNIRNLLPEAIPLRLGLSASPERHFDPVGTQDLMDYFGDVIYEYPMQQALAEGRLCPYRYHPLLVSLNEDETQQYLELTEQIAKYLPRDQKSGEWSQSALRLLIMRSRVLANAQEKLEVLDRLLESLPQKPRKAIFYCGDGKISDHLKQEETRQITAVSRLLGSRHQMSVRNYTAKENPKERQEILNQFESGALDALVAIRCLDEGIDLPELHTGFLLASSTNPRQFVQRRGRLLRNHPGKSRAVIYDFIVKPPYFEGELDDQAFNMERDFFEREMRRVSLFCELAENGPEAKNQLKEMRVYYQSFV